jgi:hypothetical protein
MEPAQIIFIVAIFCFAADALKDIETGRINLVAAGLCLFAIAIFLA